MQMGRRGAARAETAEAAGSQVTQGLENTVRPWRCGSVAEDGPTHQGVTALIPGQGTCWVEGLIPSKNIYKKRKENCQDFEFI